jgi:uncharacterized membrane-anchored protein
MLSEFRTLSVFAAVLLIQTAGAQEQPKSLQQAEAIAASLNYQTGEITLRNGLATVRVPEGMRYLSGRDANTVLVTLWGNPPSEEPLGMLMPDVSPLSPESWAIVLSYSDDGYVKDEEAGKIDYAQLLKEMQKGTQDANKAREEAGYGKVELVGWAAPPRYDGTAKKLYWAKELKFGDAPEENTLNYDIRLLGRRGVLVLSAVAAMSQLPQIEQQVPAILASVDFNPGHRYADFSQASGDKVAEYGIGALIAGGVAAKMGLFKTLWIAILASKKFIIMAVVAIGAWAVNFWRNRSAARSPSTE